MREELELGPLTLNVWLEDVGWQVPWGPELQLAWEGLPLLPLWVKPMGVDGTKQVQEDGTMVEKEAMAK